MNRCRIDGWGRVNGLSLGGMARSEEKIKKSGLEPATLISVSNPVSQVLW